MRYMNSTEKVHHRMNEWTDISWTEGKETYTMTQITESEHPEKLKLWIKVRWKMQNCTSELKVKKFKFE